MYLTTYMTFPITAQNLSVIVNFIQKKRLTSYSSAFAKSSN